MHYIVESVEQLERLEREDTCYVALIANNDNLHPKLATPTLIYYRTSKKGYIIVLDHSEGFKLDFDTVHTFLKCHDKVFCLNAKYHSYFLSCNLLDLNFCSIVETGTYYETPPSVKAYDYFYNKYGDLVNVNKIIPISKHYEKQEMIYEDVWEYMGCEANMEFLKMYIDVYKKVEQEGIGISGDVSVRNKNFSIYDNVIYTSYNLYNITKRPTNAFNGINFLALNKEDGSREVFIPKNDAFVELDFDSYHLRIIGELIGYSFDRDLSVHEQLGRLYFNKTTPLSSDEYEESKKITFQNIYGGIKPSYQEIEFFKRINEYINQNYSKWLATKKITLPTGDTIPINFESNPLKIFNYIIQNLETKYNVVLISHIQDYLKDKKSHICLIVYDSFLIDFCFNDGKQVLHYIRDFLYSKNVPIKAKVGINYNSLKKTDIYK